MVMLVKKKAYSLFLIFIINCLTSCKNTSTSPSFFSPTEQIVEEIPDFGNFINEMEALDLVFEEIDAQMLPDIIYAILTVCVKEETFEIQVEIIEDQKNGKRYHIKNEYIDIWVENEQLKILYQEDVPLIEPLPDEYLELYINYLEAKSATNDFLFVDLKRQMIFVFENYNGYYFLIQKFPCASGKNATPTKRGHFIIENKGPVFYNEAKFYKCYYWLKYSGQYLLHSVPYSLDGEILNTAMQKKVSNGCIRTEIQNAKWLYENIDTQTTIWVY